MKKEMDYLYQLVRKGDMGSNDFLNHLINDTKNHKELSKNAETSNTESLDEVMKELQQLIGLDDVKNMVNEIVAYVEIQQKRRLQGLNASPLVLHMVFKGNPGTGKTTVARILGRIFKAMGLLEKGHMIEIERADLVGEYIGHTALKVREQVKQGLGGILFIDEAYSLARGGEKDFGKEAIDALVKAMEDHKDEFILILAGYQEEMEGFLNINPGLKSRFPIHIDFKDYSIEELVEIAESMVDERQYTISRPAKAKLYNILASKRRSDERYAGNARLVRNLIEKSIRRHAVRLKKQSFCTREDLMILKKEDFMDGENI
nr:AAA family ATPase [Clostridium formicaceticum]